MFLDRWEFVLSSTCRELKEKSVGPKWICNTAKTNSYLVPFHPWQPTEQGERIPRLALPTIQQLCYAGITDQPVGWMSTVYHTPTERRFKCWQFSCWRNDQIQDRHQQSSSTNGGLPLNASTEDGFAVGAGNASEMISKISNLLVTRNFCLIMEGTEIFNANPDSAIWFCDEIFTFASFIIWGRCDVIDEIVYDRFLKISDIE